MQSDSVINLLNKSLTSELNDDVFNEFTARIQTFIDGQKWMKKPMSLSPPKCAQYGWKCIKPDLLECVTCGAKLSAYGANIGNYEAYKACIAKTICDLKNSHRKHCPWPLTPSPENFIKMILMPKEEAMSMFLKRVESSLNFQSSIPQIKESVFSDLGFNEQHLASLCKLAKIKTEDVSLLGISIVSLSATGWIITKENECDNSVLKCNNCLRSIWCGSFSLVGSNESQIKKSTSTKLSENGISDDSGQNTNSDEPPTKKKKLSFKNGEPFNPLREHRPWCMWVHGGVEDYIPTSCGSELDKVTPTVYAPGWKIFVKSLLRNIVEDQNLEINSSPSKTQIKNVRHLLEKWTYVV